MLPGREGFRPGVPSIRVRAANDKPIDTERPYVVYLDDRSAATEPDFRSTVL
jgi:hypothetical protein